jgi:hypothetical protein
MSALNTRSCNTQARKRNMCTSYFLFLSSRSSVCKDVYGGFGRGWSHAFNIWHIFWKPELWSQQRQPLLGNDCINTPVVKQWLSSRYLIAASDTHAKIERLMEAAPGHTDWPSVVTWHWLLTLTLDWTTLFVWDMGAMTWPHGCTSYYRSVLSSEKAPYMKTNEINCDSKKLKSSHLSQKGPDIKTNWSTDRRS